MAPPRRAPAPNAPRQPKRTGVKASAPARRATPVHTPARANKPVRRVAPRAPPPPMHKRRERALRVPRARATRHAAYAPVVTNVVARQKGAAIVVGRKSKPPPLRVRRRRAMRDAAANDPEIVDGLPVPLRSYRVYRRIPITPELTRAWLQELLVLVNAERTCRDLHPVVINALLTRVAELHNADQALCLVRLSHISADGSSLKQRLKRQGYKLRYAAENVAAGQISAQRVHSSWMRSPGHRRNVLNPHVRELGMCVGHGADGRLFWTQVFGLRMGASYL